MSCKYLNSSTKGRIANIVSYQEDSSSLESDSISVFRSPVLRSSGPSVEGVAESIAQGMINNFNSKMSELSSALSSAGLDSSIIDGAVSNIESTISSIVDTSSIASELGNIVEELVEKLKDEIMKARELLKNTTDDIKFQSYQVFNAKESLVISEHKPTEQKTSNPTDIQDANYTLEEDYPTSYGSIDEAKNWTKINKTTGLTERMYASRANEKIDGKGNRTFYLPGSEKTFVDKDKIHETLGNEEWIIGGNLRIHVKGNVEYIVDGNRNITTKGNKTETIQKDSTLSITGNESNSVNGSRTNSTSGNNTISVGGSLTQSVSGSLSSSAGGGSSSVSGGTMSLKASTINLN